MTAMNMPIMPAVTKKPVAPAEEKRLPREGSNNSFYKQLKQLSPKKLPENENTNVAARVSRIGQKPGEQEIKVEDKPADQNHTQVINQAAGKPDSPGVPDPEETVENQVEADSLEETSANEAGMGAVTEIEESVSQSYNQVLVPSVIPAALSEQVDGQATDNPEPVAATIITVANPVNNELLLLEVTVSDQEESSSLQAGIPVQGSEESELPIGDAKAAASDPVQQLTTNSNSSVATTEEAQTSNVVMFMSPDQPDGKDYGNSSARVANNNTPANPPITGINSNTDKTMETSVKTGEEVKPEVNPGQMTATADRAAKEAAEAKPLVKEPLPTQSGNQKPQSQSEAETRQNADRDFTAGSKTSPATDIKKLINFETHRLNASRLTPEPEQVSESQTKTGSNDAKTVLNALARSDTDLLKATANTNGTDSSRSLPTTREIMAQIVQKTELLFTNKLSELRIDLKPEFLGRLTIKVMVEEGVVTARFIAENQQVKHMLESNLNTLRQNLEAQGIRVERAEVSVQLNNGGMFDGSEDSRQYLWEEGQFSENHQREGPYGNNHYTGGYEDMDPVVTQGRADYDYNENGSLNFLI